MSELEKQVGTTKDFCSHLYCAGYYQYIWFCCNRIVYIGVLWFRFFNKYYCLIGWCSSRLGGCTIFLTFYKADRGKLNGKKIVRVVGHKKS